MSRLALVTGANKGIGYEIVRRLARESTNMNIILTARNVELGEKALNSLKTEGFENVSFHQLDITQESSIRALYKHIESLGGLDVLINNAGIATKGSTFNDEVAKLTIDTNYRATAMVTDILFPLLLENARVVMVGSTAGQLGKYGERLREQFMSPELTRSQLDSLADEFISLAGKGVDAALGAGWPNNTYSVSKALLAGYTRVIAREEGGSRGININVVCPGWCRTDMAGNSAPNSAEQGSKTPVWAALMDKGDHKTGLFFRNKRKISYV